MHIKEFVQKELKTNGLKQFEFAKELTISPAMLSSYLNQGFNPSLDVARIIYSNYEEIIYPFSLEAVDV